MPSKTEFDALESVRERYADGALRRVPELCCPVDYDASLLKVLPEELLERDYGCGDPSRFVREGDIVLDLGAGAGKICYMASQLVGPVGRVIGVDATPEMLALARGWQAELGRRIGWTNTEFRHGLIQDLRLDRDQLAAWLERNPVKDLAGAEALAREERRLRLEQPLIPDASVDLVLSNCVLNLVDSGQKEQLFAEIARVLRPGGRCAISDIVSDEDVPAALQADPELWSGCISGALREDRFLDAFTEAGLHGARVESWQGEAWAVVEGLEFRSVTVTAWKAGEASRKDHREAVVYRGPFAEVVDDAGRRFRRGERTAVRHGDYERLGREPYAEHFTAIEPLVPVSEAEAQDFACCRDARRDPAETKAGAVRSDVAPGTSSGCC